MEQVVSVKHVLDLLSNRRVEVKRACAHRYLLQTHLLLTAVSFTATEDLQSHNLSMATHISKDLKKGSAGVKHPSQDSIPPLGFAFPHTLSLNKGSMSAGHTGLG